jgi:hypothetical protein
VIGFRMITLSIYLFLFLWYILRGVTNSLHSVDLKDDW